MTVKELEGLLEAERLTAGDADGEISGGYVCDVLSVAMVEGFAGMAWITVQANINALAVAVMRGASCLVFPHGRKAEQDVIDRANANGVALLSSSAAAYEIAGRMSAAGLRGGKVR